LNLFSEQPVRHG
jgi:hypothetical protein